MPVRVSRPDQRAAVFVLGTPAPGSVDSGCGGFGLEWFEIRLGDTLDFEGPRVKAAGRNLRWERN